jgi:uncharacterized RDD family membrane protein YckC
MSVAAGRFVVLQTAEGVEFRLPLAGPFARAMAVLVDTLIVGVLTASLGKLAAVISLVSGDLGTAIAVILYFVVFFGYSMTLEWKLRGQTLGKRLFRLRVVDEGGRKLTFPQVAVRNLLRVVDILPVGYAVGGVASLFSRHAQRLGDFAAGTVVIYAEQRGLPELSRLIDSHYNSIREHPRLVARLRQEMSPEQARIALDAVLRREQLTPEARVELFRTMATDLQKQVRIPEEYRLGLSDERLVLGIIEALFEEKNGKMAPGAQAK